MGGPDILEHYRNRLVKALAERGQCVPSVTPLEISPWLAMSLMQKAIRRNKLEFALQAAATLLRDTPERLWRRLCITAYEDIGIADFETVALVTAAMKGKRWRNEIGGEWAVASYLIQRMCRAIKCRATDDLYVVCERHPDFEEARLSLTFKAQRDLTKVLDSNAALPERALALWFAMGTNRARSNYLRERRGEPQSTFDSLCELGFANDLVEVCREGFNKTGAVIAPFLVLLSKEARDEKATFSADEFPEEELIGQVPSWSFDKHVREGKQAMARFLHTGCQSAHWIADQRSGVNPIDLLGDLLFRIESGLVDQRQRWVVGNQLREMADTEIYGLAPEIVANGLAQMKTDLSILNVIRSQMLRPSFFDTVNNNHI